MNPMVPLLVFTSAASVVMFLLELAVAIAALALLVEIVTRVSQYRVVQILAFALVLFAAAETCKWMDSL